jgi:hypothetical protein
MMDTVTALAELGKTMDKKSLNILNQKHGKTSLI